MKTKQSTDKETQAVSYTVLWMFLHHRKARRCFMPCCRVILFYVAVNGLWLFSVLLVEQKPQY